MHTIAERNTINFKIKKHPCEKRCFLVDKVDILILLQAVFPEYKIKYSVD